MKEQTKNDLIYTIIGVLLTVPVMTIFNKYLVYSQWMEFPLTTGSFWIQVLIGIGQRIPVAFVLQFFFAQRFAEKHTNLHVKPGDDEIYVRAVRTGFTTVFMCPVMSFYANLLLVFEGNVTSAPVFINNWIPKMAINWVYAFFIQTFLVGPLNKKLFLIAIRKRH